jgi:hypothetical protein
MDTGLELITVYATRIQKETRRGIENYLEQFGMDRPFYINLDRNTAQSNRVPISEGRYVH